VTPTGKKNHYDGPESIRQYYSLQNEYFNPYIYVYIYPDSTPNPIQVTHTGKKNHYDGPESIMEYYSLQNEYFNPYIYVYTYPDPTSNPTQVTPTGKKNHYDGPESIMEYYSLQNEYFNPPSYRLAVSVYNLTKHYYPKWDSMLPDGKRIHSWNFDPAITLGVPLTHGEPPYDFSQVIYIYR